MRSLERPDGDDYNRRRTGVKTTVHRDQVCMAGCTRQVEERDEKSVECQAPFLERAEREVGAEAAAEALTVLRATLREPLHTLHDLQLATALQEWLDTPEGCSLLPVSEGVEACRTEEAAVKVTQDVAPGATLSP
jgi:hypothetical protein